MSSLSLFGLCVIVSLTWTEAGLNSTDHLMFATKGDRITLPCGIPSIKSCSSIKWNKVDRKGFTEEVKAGKGTYSKDDKYRLLKDCSLEITHLEHNDAYIYTCDNGTVNSTVSLHILDITENRQPREGTIELHCSLNMFGGVQDCKNNTGIQIKWTSQDDTPINGDRFRFENPSVCFSKLIITKKPTDHRRKWKCRVAQNDEFKADISDTTTVKDGVEEVFVAVGESVSLTCSNTSSLSFGGRIMRAVETNPLTDISSDSNQKKTVYVSKDTSLVINKLSSLHARDYQCAEFTAQQEVPTKIRLHTLNVIAEAGPSGDNVTLTCVLTCAKECEKDFNLTLSGRQQEQISSQSGLMNVSNTLKRMLFLPVWPRSSDEIVCSVHREGALMASKKWRSPNSLPALIWLGLPLGLLVCAAAVVLYRHMKKKHNKDAANEQCGITMDHVYDVIQDEELQEKREVAAVADGFYDLLQPVN